MMKRTMKLSGLLLAILLALTIVLPAAADTLTIHFPQDESKARADRFNFGKESVELSAYLVAKGSYGQWEFMEAYEGIQFFDGNGAFQKTCMTEVRNRIREKGIQPVASGTTKASTGLSGIVTIEVTQPGMYFVAQTRSVTDGTVRTSDMMLATQGADTVDAKWVYTPPKEEVPHEDGPYTLTIHYVTVDFDGTQNEFATYPPTEFWPDERYYVVSRTAPTGYGPPSLEYVEGKMPHHDIEYWVYYYPRVPGKEYPPIEDYKTPLGLGDIQMHVGVCYE